MPPQAADTDAALVARMATGDEQALGALYDRYATTIHTIAYYLLGQPDEAEDAVEETFWQAWREASRYDASRGAVSTWLSTIGRSRSLDRKRAMRRRAEDPIDTTDSAAPASPDAADRADSMAPVTSPHVNAEAAERARDIATALSKLPAEQREVIELAYFGGLSQSEIAARTSIPLGTVKTRARLALEKLRAPLAMHRETTL
ncbi:MAG: sigma-70 family RNA polymerase sigma factor [Gemmatimonadaceae bacterium]